MSDWPEIPNFGEALAAHITSVPAEAQATFLAGLERAAAARYREWAAELPDHASVLEACAAREEQIAELVADLFTLSPDAQTALEAAVPGAVATFLEVFAPHPILSQLYIQSEAELQGAQAWRGMASQVEDAATKETLARCTALEEESSRALKELLAKIA